MKGFGYSREKKLIAKAIETRNLEEVAKIMVEISQRLSARQRVALVLEVISTRAADDRFWLYGSLVTKNTWEDMLPEIFRCLYDFFYERGLKQGRDFGKNLDAVWVSRSSSEAILPELPDSLREAFQKFINGGWLSIEDAPPVEAIEKDLGMHFIENLVRLMEQRMPTLTDGQAATY